MKRIAIGLVCLLSACASTYAANPSDPVDMAAELGNRGQRYVGMGQVCDGAVGAGHHRAIVETIRLEQSRLGTLSGLVNRAYRGRADNDLAVHMSNRMGVHNVSAPEFCAEVVRQARVEMHQRANHVLSLSYGPDVLDLVRESTRPPYHDTPSFNPNDGYLSWVE